MEKKIILPRFASGQALVLIALAAIGLFGITGLAIDGSAKFSDRRHAQNAADTAALAGALAKYQSERDGLSDSPITCPAPSLPYSDVCNAILDAAKQRATDNGYDGDLVRSVVGVYRPPISGVYSNCSDVHFSCNDYVQVIIDSNVDTLFARVIGISQIHNHVEAVASTISEDSSFNFGGNAIVALKPSGCDALRAQGGAQIKIYGGGLYSNSDDASCSFFRQSCPSGSIGVFTDSTETTQGTITMVGDTTSACGSTQAGFDSAATQISFPPPYQEIAEPAECAQAVDLGSNYSVTGSGSSKTATLQPGHYSSIPLSGQWKNIILNPGVYCINSTLNSPDSLSMASGSTGGVMIYFKAGGSFTFNGGSVINLWGINSSNDSSLSAYQGFLMYVAPNYALGTPPNCKLNGNTDYALLGTIYAPYCAITIDGTSNTGSFQSQVIGYTVNMAGTADIILNYAGGDNATWQIPWQVGLTK
jgi:putative Flp pilus-assembly TadE/G-like protein